MTGEEQPQGTTLKLIKLTARVNKLEGKLGEIYKYVNDLSDEFTKLTGKKAEVTPEEEDNDYKIQPINNDTDEVNKPETVEHPKFIDDEVPGNVKLTDNQGLCLKLLRKKLSNTKIAEELGISRVMVWKIKKRLIELKLIE